MHELADAIVLCCADVAQIFRQRPLPEAGLVWGCVSTGQSMREQGIGCDRGTTTQADALASRRQTKDKRRLTSQEGTNLLKISVKRSAKERQGQMGVWRRNQVLAPLNLSLDF